MVECKLELDALKCQLGERPRSRADNGPQIHAARTNKHDLFDYNGRVSERMKLTILKIVELLEFRGFESHLFLFERRSVAQPGESTCFGCERENAPTLRETSVVVGKISLKLKFPS